jgi:hypothetical protein
MLPERASGRCPIDRLELKHLRGWQKRTFSTSPREYICLAVRLDVQIGSMSSVSDGLLVVPSGLDVIVVRNEPVAALATVSASKSKVWSKGLAQNQDLRIRLPRVRENRCIAGSTERIHKTAGPRNPMSSITTSRPHLSAAQTDPKASP